MRKEEIERIENEEMNSGDAQAEIRELTKSVNSLKRSVRILTVLLAISLLLGAVLAGRLLLGGNKQEETADKSRSDYSTSEKQDFDNSSSNSQYEDNTDSDADSAYGYNNESDNKYKNQYEEDDSKVSAGGIDENGEYTTAADVAAYIHKYHKLPPNYVLDKEAKKMGWKKSECPADYGIMIGGRRFQNREKLLPEDEEYYECDVDYNGDRRGVNRLVFTKDGKVYHTTDHYKSYEQLY